MTAQKTTVGVGFSAERFPAGTHMCLVYRDEASRRRIVAKFVESGIAEDERVYYFADTPTPSDVADWLAGLDVDLSDAIASHELSMDQALSTYCPDGTFDPTRMCNAVRNAYSASQDEGYAHARVTGEMTWALRGLPGSDLLMTYEAAVNDVVKTHPITAMCQYDANRFDGETIFDALRVHPYMVMNGQLVRNPYFAVEE